MKMEGNRADAVSVISIVIWKNCKTDYSFPSVSIIRQIYRGIGYVCTADIKSGGVSYAHAEMLRSGHTEHYRV